MSFTTTNMNLILPSVLVDVGPTYATLIDNALVTIDSHNHSTGQGSQITPAGLNISSDLTFAQNNATNLRTLRFYPNTSISLGVNDKGCLYELNNELYYVDGAGNNVQVTSSGAINIAGVSSITLKDSLFILQYFGDTSRQARFDVSNVPSSTTRIYKLPTVAANDTLASLTATQTLTATTLTNGVISGSTAVTLISGAGTLTLPTSGTITIPGATDTVALLAASQTITGKILTGNTIASFTPNGGTNTLTAPAITDTLVTKTSTDTLSNKTLATPIVSTTATFTEISTPSNPASGKLSIYAKSDDNFYSLNSSGLEQQIGAGGSGGAINYISNNGFENGTVTGWATYSGGTTTPTNGTGGSPSSTFAINSSSPLRGTYDGLWTKSANNRQGEGFSYAFTLATADLGKTLQITFDSIASVNMVSGDMTVYIYDVTNSVLITPSSINVPTGTSSQYSLCFQATTGTSYRLIFHTSTTSALAYTLHVDQMSISPIVRPMVAGESDWVAYTPTFSAGFGTVTNAAGQWRRIGDTAQIMVSCTTGTVAGSIATITLPSVITGINSSKLTINNTTSNPGPSIGNFYNNGLAGNFGSMVTATGTSTILVYIGASGSGSSLPLTPIATASSVLSNTTVFSAIFTLPVTGWSSNITLASTTPVIEYVYNTSGLTTAGSSDTTSFGYGANGAAIGSIASTTVTGNSATSMTVQFQNPIQPTDRIQIEINNGTSANGWANIALYAPTILQGAAFYGVQLGLSTSTKVIVYFGNGGLYPTGGTYATAGTAWSGISTYRWRVAKYSSIGGAELAPATSTSTGTISRENIWTSYSPSLSAGFGTCTNVSTYYKILGDSLFIRGSFTTGTVAGSVGSITIPIGLTISSTKLSLTNTSSQNGCILGVYGQNSATTKNNNGYILSATGTATDRVYVGFSNTTGAGSPLLMSSISAGSLESTQVISYNFEVPLV